MPNMSPWGAFSENLAAGASKGMDNYVQLAIAGIDKQEKKDIAIGQAAYKIFADESLPVNIRKQAYGVWKTKNKDWGTGIQAPDFPDDYWTNKKLTPYFNRGNKILANKEYTNENKISYLKELEVEAIDALENDTETHKIFGGMIAGVEKEQKAALFAPQTETIPGVPSQHEPSQFGRGLTMPAIAPTIVRSPSVTTEAMGLTPREAEGMQGLISGGESIKDARGLITPKALTEREQYETDPEGYKKFKAAERAPKELTQPTPVNWTTATNQVSNRFGKQDAMGNIIITPELQGMNRIAQKKLVELKRDKNVDPLDAVNIAEDFARNVESRYWEYLDAAQGRRELIQKVSATFKSKYGYIPKRQPR